MIIKITKDDIKEVAEIHKSNLPSILGNYPLSFIEKFYKYQLDDDNIILGYKSSEKLLGFAFGTYNVDKIYDNFIAENRLYFIINTLFVVIKNPRILLFFVAKFFKKQYVSPCKVQFVYMSLRKENEGSGIGYLLCLEFEKHLKTDYYELEVDEKNPALKFHLRNKCFIVNEYNNFIEKKYLLGKKLIKKI